MDAGDSCDASSESIAIGEKEVSDDKAKDEKTKPLFSEYVLNLTPTLTVMDLKTGKLKSETSLAQTVTVRIEADLSETLASATLTKSFLDEASTRLLYRLTNQFLYVKGQIMKDQELLTLTKDQLIAEVIRLRNQIRNFTAPSPEYWNTIAEACVATPPAPVVA
jgi:hypothetical protein